MTLKQKKLLNKIIKEEVSKILNEGTSSKSAIVQFLKSSGSNKFKEDLAELLIVYLRRYNEVKGMPTNVKDLILQVIWQLKDIPTLKTALDSEEED